MAGGFVDIDSGSLLTSGLDAIDDFLVAKREREDKAQQDTAAADALAAGAEMQELIKGEGNPQEKVRKLARFMRERAQTNPHLTPHLAKILPGLGRTMVEQARGGRPPNPLEQFTADDVEFFNRGRPDIPRHFPREDGSPDDRTRATAPMANAEAAQGQYDLRARMLRRNFADGQAALAEWQGGQKDALAAAELLGYAPEKPEYKFVTENGRVFATNSRTGKAHEVAYAPKQDEDDKEPDYPVILSERDVNALASQNPEDARLHFQSLAKSDAVKDMWEGEQVNKALEDYNRKLSLAGLNQNMLDLFRTVREEHGNDANVLGAFQWVKSWMQKVIASGSRFSMNADKAQVEYHNNPPEGVLPDLVNTIVRYFAGSNAETTANAMENVIRLVEQPATAREALAARGAVVRALENHLSGNVAIRTPDGNGLVSDPTFIRSLADVLIEEAPKLPNRRRAAPPAPRPPNGKAWTAEDF